nr:MAG: putative RNA-dependent RNA polymerase [Narnaviridae sp.]
MVGKSQSQSKSSRPKPEIRCMNFRTGTRKAAFEGLLQAIFLTFRVIPGNRNKVRSVVRSFVRGQFKEVKGCKAHLNLFKVLTGSFLDSLGSVFGGGDQPDLHPIRRFLSRTFVFGKHGTCKVRCNGEDHLGMGLRQRLLYTFAGTLVSAKKRLPRSCRCLEEGVKEKTLGILGTSGPEVSEDYLAWARHISAGIVGRWKSSKGRMDFDSYVRRHLPGQGASSTHKRSDGGKRAFWGDCEFGSSDFARLFSDPSFFYGKMEEFEEGYDEDGKPLVRYGLVEDKGKARGITITHGSMEVLMPVHRMVYDILSRERWLLRGEATREKFRDFRAIDEFGVKSVFVSGDYEGATDHLPIKVQEECLTVFLDAMDIPDHIRSFALDSLRTTIFTREGKDTQEYPHNRGQLMGSPLSFPFLCLQNYVLFSYTYRREDAYKRIPVRINGDDIVFRVPEGRDQDFFVECDNLGVKLSRSKTSVHRHFFSLNSRYFWGTGSMVDYLPTFKLGYLSYEDKDLATIEELRKGFLGLLHSDLRDRAEEVFFDHWSKRIAKRYLKKGIVKHCPAMRNCRIPVSRSILNNSVESELNETLISLDWGELVTPLSSALRKNDDKWALLEKESRGGILLLPSLSSGRRGSRVIPGPIRPMFMRNQVIGLISLLFGVRGKAALVSYFRRYLTRYNWYSSLYVNYKGGGIGSERKELERGCVWVPQEVGSTYFLPGIADGSYDVITRPRWRGNMIRFVSGGYKA